MLGISKRAREDVVDIPLQRSPSRSPYLPLSLSLNMCDPNVFLLCKFLQEPDNDDDDDDDHCASKRRETRQDEQEEEKHA